MAVHTCACLLLLLNTFGVYCGSKRAILFSIISAILIFGVTAYTYASFILLGWSLSINLENLNGRLITVARL